MKSIDLQSFIKINGLTQKNIAEFLEVSPAFISQIINQERLLPADKLTKLLNHPTWNITPLLKDVRYQADMSTAPPLPDGTIFLPKKKKTTPFLSFLVENAISKKEIAEYLGCDVNRVSRIIVGKEPLPPEELEHIFDHPLWDTSMLEVVALEKNTPPEKPLTYEERLLKEIEQLIAINRQQTQSIAELIAQQGQLIEMLKKEK